ncbi:MAG: 2-oxo acid dehydrogenase subunit E2 [Oligoflexia bacterium]|nr:2-oxo acid dehydrogenase subunit E2 [Oligoflexia bacterium]
MRVEMVMPQMGESIAEATVSKWRKQVGETVEKDEIILEISTDKVDSEIPSPASGTIVEILAKETDVVPVKTKIAIIETEAGAAATKAPAVSAATPVPQASNGSHATPKPAPIPAAAPVPAAQETSSSDRFYSPLVRSLAEKHGVPLAELDKVQGSGQGGRLNKEDFLAYVKTRGSGSQQSKPASTPAKSAPSTSKMSDTDWGADGHKVVLMDNMRQAIAEHMVRSKQTSPHVYSIQEVDCSAIAKYRAKHKAAFEAREGFKLSFTPFFLEAAVRGLLEFPYVNSSIDGKKIILHRNVNLGCAVALGNSGLIVPVIKRAEERNFVGIARGLNDLALRARNKKLLPDDVAGGTFTVTNPGVFGTIIGTPIINQPQVAILCLGAIVKRPVVIDDMIAIREMCYLTLSYDHRIVDGALGGQYLAFVRDYLEKWDLDRPLY